MIGIGIVWPRGERQAGKSPAAAAAENPKLCRISSFHAPTFRCHGLTTVPAPLCSHHLTQPATPCPRACVLTAAPLVGPLSLHNRRSRRSCSPGAPPRAFAGLPAACPARRRRRGAPAAVEKDARFLLPGPHNNALPHPPPSAQNPAFGQRPENSRDFKRTKVRPVVLSGMPRLCPACQALTGRLCACWRRQQRRRPSSSGAALTAAAQAWKRPSLLPPLPVLH